MANITCSGNGTDVHPSCSCPPPIRYIVYIVLASVALCVVIFLIVLAVCCCYRRRRKCRNKSQGYRTVSVCKAKSCIRIHDGDNESLGFDDNDDELLLS